MRTFGNLGTRVQNELGNKCAKWKEEEEVLSLENYWILVYLDILM